MFQPRWYQADAEQSVYSYFQHKKGNPVIALPTGTGKSIVIANLITNSLRRWPNQRFLMLTHVKELIEQNANKLLKLWPTAPLGIFSAGLKRKEVHAPIVFGGVASVANNLQAFGHRDLCFVDECHLVPPEADTRYMQVFKGLLEINPYMKIIGLSATPFRLGQGYITDGGIFTDICYDQTGVEAFNRLIAEGFLAPLIPKRTDLEIDVSGVSISKGEFKEDELQALVDQEKITYGALQETMQYATNRRCCLVFATGIQHAEHIAAMLSTVFRQQVVCLHSKQDNSVNRDHLSRWQSGAVKWAVSVIKLTTGVDTPMLDLIVDIQPTMSTVRHIQKYGRGTRPSPETGKRECLVLDFAGNTKRLGPINDPVIPRKKGQATGDAPIKICDTCGCYNHAAVRFCMACGAEFVFDTKYKSKAGTEELISTGFPQVETFDVNRVIYAKEEKAGTAYMKVSYFCGLQMYQERIFLNHKGYARKKALDWLRQRMPLAKEYEDGATTENVLTIVSTLRPPKRIRVWVNKQYPEVLSYEY